RPSLLVSAATSARVLAGNGAQLPQVLAPTAVCWRCHAPPPASTPTRSRTPLALRATAMVATPKSPSRVNGDQLLSLAEVCALRQTCPASSTPRTSMRPSLLATAVIERSCPAKVNWVQAVQVRDPGEVCER